MWLALGGVALLVGGCSIGAVAASSGESNESQSAGSSSTVTVTETVTAEVEPAEEPQAEESESESADDQPAPDDGTEPSFKFPKQNGDWRLDTLQVTETYGDFEAVGRITYTGDDKSGGENTFKVTLFSKDGSTIIATMDTYASDVKPGQTVTVDFYSFDAYQPGKFPSTFQNNF